MDLVRALRSEAVKKLERVVNARRVSNADFWWEDYKMLLAYVQALEDANGKLMIRVTELEAKKP